MPLHIFLVRGVPISLVNIDVSRLIKVLRMNTRSVASLNILLRLCLLLLLRHFIDLILHDHVRI
jgi:hypothetical protein